MGRRADRGKRVAMLSLFVLVTASCAYVTRASVGVNGGGAAVEANGESIDASLSADGSLMAFASFADNLVPGDNNNDKDIFVRDLQAGTTELISKGSGGGPANGLSGQPEISPDGRWVVYWSFADDIVAGDTNAASDVFLYDRQNDVTERVSVDSNENQAIGGSLGGSVSDDGRFVTFYTTAQLAAGDTNNDFDVYVRDRALGGVTRLVSSDPTFVAVGGSFDPVISGNGQAIVFWSFSDDILAADTNGQPDVYWHNVPIGFEVLVSVDAGGGPTNGGSFLPDVSELGDIVVYESIATDIVAGDTNGVSDVFRWDLNTNANSMVSARPQATGFTPSNGSSGGPSVDADGSVIAFNSSATNLDSGSLPGPADTNGLSDVYMWVEEVDGFGGIGLVSQTVTAGVANGVSVNPAVSADGSAVAYQSLATNFGSSTDTNGVNDVFVRPVFVPQIYLVSPTPPVVGTTSGMGLMGLFSPDTQAFLSGDGVVSVEVVSYDPNLLGIEITTTAGATPGNRTLWVYDPAPQLGMGVLGSGDNATVTLVP